ncbi:MAG: LysR family transcriptional regulator [Nocardioides sp.]|uniref:LysR family transcriptional regulator n=1 Tax=Nocardioides sp. TaxID=35761 RepID=UPI0039E4180C
MTPADFDLKLLVALRALLEEANVSRAGERLQTQQSTMSAALAKLRTQFDDELLVRVGRDYTLTPLARELLPQVQRTLAQIERAFTSESAFDPATASRAFTFLCSDHVAVEVRGLLADTLVEAPGIGFEFRSTRARSPGSEGDLMGNDLVIAAAGNEIEGRSIELYVDHYVCLLDRNHRALVGGRLSWEAFTSLPQAVSAFDRTRLGPVVRRLAALDFRREPEVRVAGFVPLAAVVAGTDLVAVVPSRLAERLGPATGTVGVPAPFGEIEIVETVYWHPSREQDRAHAWLRDRLADRRAAVPSTGCGPRA